MTQANFYSKFYTRQQPQEIGLRLMDVDCFHIDQELSLSAKEREQNKTDHSVGA